MLLGCALGLDDAALGGVETDLVRVLCPAARQRARSLALVAGCRRRLGLWRLLAGDWIDGLQRSRNLLRDLPDRRREQGRVVVDAVPLDVNDILLLRESHDLGRVVHALLASLWVFLVRRCELDALLQRQLVPF